jgi:hypothetical protein
LRRLLRSAARFKEQAILRGSRDRKTFGSQSSALLCGVTRADQRLLLLRLRLFEDCLALFAILPIRLLA